MQRISTTVVVLLGGEPELVRAAGRAANVRSYEDDLASSALERAVTAWSRAREARSTYFVHDADPLAAVAEAWVRRFDAAGPAGELEVAVAETLARWRNGAIELPDYYFIVSPENWPTTLRHFFLGYLQAAAPTRVTVTEPGRIATTLGALGSGKWWPDLDELLRGIDLAVPDQVGLTSPSENESPGANLVAGVPIVAPASR